MAGDSFGEYAKSEKYDAFMTETDSLVMKMIIIGTFPVSARITIIKHIIVILLSSLDCPQTIIKSNKTDAN